MNIRVRGGTSHVHVTRVGGREKNFDLRSAPCVFFSYTEQPYPSKHGASSESATGLMKGWRVWSFSLISPEFSRKWCQNSGRKIQRQSIDVKERKEKHGDERGKGEGRRKKLRESGVKAGWDLQPSFQWAKTYKLESHQEFWVFAGRGLTEATTVWKSDLWLKRQLLNWLSNWFSPEILASHSQRAHCIVGGDTNYCTEIVGSERFLVLAALCQPVITETISEDSFTSQTLWIMG